jgi:hypothetical protein
MSKNVVFWDVALWKPQILRLLCRCKISLLEVRHCSETSRNVGACFGLPPPTTRERPKGQQGDESSWAMLWIIHREHSREPSHDFVACTRYPETLEKQYDWSEEQCDEAGKSRWSQQEHWKQNIYFRILIQEDLQGCTELRRPDMLLLAKIFFSFYRPTPPY